MERKEGYLLVDEIKSEVQLSGAFHEVRMTMSSFFSIEFKKYLIFLFNLVCLFFLFDFTPGFCTIHGMLLG